MMFEIFGNVYGFWKILFLVLFLIGWKFNVSVVIEVVCMICFFL